MQNNIDGLFNLMNTDNYKSNFGQCWGCPLNCLQCFCCTCVVSNHTPPPPSTPTEALAVDCRPRGVPARVWLGNAGPVRRLARAR